MLLAFVRGSLHGVSRRGLVVLNWLFFGVMVVGAFLEQSGCVGCVWFVGEDFAGEATGNVLFMVLGIFVFNLVFSGFVLLTLSGLAFFALSVGFLLFRALLWGMLLNRLSTPLFLAALVGVRLGLSWLRPKWLFKGEELSRLEAVKRAFKESVQVYVFVAFLLFLAAVMEVATITLMP